MGNRGVSGLACRVSSARLLRALGYEPVLDDLLRPVLIAAALGAGAQMVLAGGVADPSLAVGPAMAHFGWCGR